MKRNAKERPTSYPLYVFHRASLTDSAARVIQRVQPAHKTQPRGRARPDAYPFPVFAFIRTGAAAARAHGGIAFVKELPRNARFRDENGHSLLKPQTTQAMQCRASRFRVTCTSEPSVNSTLAVPSNLALGCVVRACDIRCPYALEQAPRARPRALQRKHGGIRTAC